VLRELHCPLCVTPLTLSPEADRLEAPTVSDDQLFVSALPPALRNVNKRELIFRRALEEAILARRTGEPPRSRLKRRWANDREEMMSAVASEARQEYNRYDQQERTARHAANRWTHPEARALHMAIRGLTVRASEAAIVVDAWEAKSEFEALVRQFMSGDLSGDELLKAAKAVAR
jgi:hypothetical protein